MRRRERESVCVCGWAWVVCVCGGCLGLDWTGSESKTTGRERLEACRRDLDPGKKAHERTEIERTGRRQAKKKNKKRKEKRSS